MGGRRVEGRSSKRNPLYLIFLALCAAVVLLAALSVILGIRLSAANKELAQMKKQAGQPQVPAVEQVPEQTVPENTGRLPGDDVEATDPNDPASGAAPETTPETEIKVGWLDLTGHKELSVVPKSVFDQYQTYYATADVNLRAGPGTNHERITLLSSGAEVKGAAKEGNWTFVNANGKFGWVSADYLSTSKPQPKQETPKQEAPKQETTKKSGTEKSAAEQTAPQEKNADSTAPEGLDLFLSPDAAQ